MLGKMDLLPPWALEMLHFSLSEPRTENEKESYWIRRYYELKAHFFLSN